MSAVGHLRHIEHVGHSAVLIQACSHSRVFLVGIQLAHDANRQLVALSPAGKSKRTRAAKLESDRQPRKKNQIPGRENIKAIIIRFLIEPRDIYFNFFQT